MNRRLAAHRKSLHGRMVNRVLSMGNQIKLEKVPYKAWQKTFGKSIGFRAPGMFVAHTRRKAESAGGGVNEFTLRNRLSQTCHCGAVEKKSLSDRWHSCSCGVKAQRDLYSAYLATHVVGETLDIRRAKISWPGAEPLLWRAISRLKQTATGKARLASFGLGARSQSGSHAKDGSTLVEAGNVVPSGLVIGRESSGEMNDTAIRTPWL